MPPETDRPIVLVDQASDQGPVKPDEADLLRGPTPDEPYGGWNLVLPDGDVQQATAPAQITVRTYLASSPQSAASCSEVRQAAAARNIEVLAAAPARTTGADGLFAKSTYRLSMPVASPTVDEALMAVDSISGPLAGGGVIFLLRKDSAGRWRVAGIKPIWVS